LSESESVEELRTLRREVALPHPEGYIYIQEKRGKREREEGKREEGEQRENTLYLDRAVDGLQLDSGVGLRAGLGLQRGSIMSSRV
jgi:hypothetical protein